MVPGAAESHAAGTAAEQGVGRDHEEELRGEGPAREGVRLAETRDLRTCEEMCPNTFAASFKQKIMTQSRKSRRLVTQCIASPRRK